MTDMKAELGAPRIVDRSIFQAELDALRVREKAQMREGDAIAAARRRLPMVAVDGATPLIGERGPVKLLDAFEGRRLLIAYYFIWHAGRPAPEQCEGCTFYTSQVRELSFVHSRDVTYATFCQGPFEESVRYRAFMGWEMPWYSAPRSSLETLLVGRRIGMMHIVCYLRQGSSVFETYWTTRRGVEAMDNSYRLLEMKLFVFPSGRALAIMALRNHLQIDCEIEAVDLGRGDQRTPEYAARNPNLKMPMLEDDGFVLWESNAILFYLANKKPQSGLWPSSVKRQADVLRWLTWQSAHWDAESCGMVSFEKASKAVLGLGPPDPSFIARGEQNFARFAAVLDQALKGRTWLTGDALTIADFSVAGLVPSAERMQLPVMAFSEIARWYVALAALPGWRSALAARDAAMAAWQTAHTQRTGT